MNAAGLLLWLIALPFVLGLAIVGAVSWVFAFVWYFVPTLFICLLAILEVIYGTIRSYLHR